MIHNPNESDSVMVKGCINGDQPSWEFLLSKYSPLITASVKSRLKKYGLKVSSDEIKDIFQNITTYIWENNKLTQVSNTSSIANWLSILSGNKTIEYIRKKYGKRELKFIPESSLSEQDGLLYEAVQSTYKQNTQETSEMAEIIDKFWKMLPQKERLILKLNLLHGMQYSDISDMLKIPRGTVSSYIKRGKTRMKKYLINYF